MRLIPLTALVCSTAASAASISGQISDSGGGQSAEVRLWSRPPVGKWFVITTITNTATGAYSFTGLGMGDYLVDCRPGGGNGDRWYDTDGNGYVAADADVITLTPTTVRNGVDILVEPGGGVDGTVKLGASLAAGLQVRVEMTSDPRVHHNEDSHGAEHLGLFSFRGLPQGNYRIVVHDPSAAYADEVTIAPFMVPGSGLAPNVDLTLSVAASDPNGGNNTAQTGTSFTVAAGTPYRSPANSRIAPKGDIDWYCTTAAKGDRYLASLHADVLLETGSTHESPWVDPVMSAWRANDAGTFLILGQNDDMGGGSMSSALDTGELNPGGRVCFAVTTFGDTLYNGQNQGSAGDYSFNVTFGNRGTVVSATSAGSPLPTTLTINEGDLLPIDLVWSDPDSDPITAAWRMVGASGAVATAGNFTNTQSGMGTFLWRAPQTAAKDSPYILTFTVRDPEVALTRTIAITITVLEINVSPTSPIPQSPIDGGHLPSQVQPLVCIEGTDEDEETLTYEYEVYYEDAGTSAQSANVVGRDGGWKLDAGPQPALVTFNPAPIPENTHVRWRARAYDGHPANGHSAWSFYGSFVVDAVNDAPLPPVLLKPDDGEVVMVRRPTLSVTPPIDPEGDAYSLYFEVSKNASFTMVMCSSGPTAVAPGNATMWTCDMDLDWGVQYFARVYAIDVRSARSMYSNVNAFRIRDNSPPTVPEFITPDSTLCGAGFVSSAPGHVQLGPSMDSEGDAISIQLRVFRFDQDTQSATPAFDSTKAQTPTSTEFDVSGVTVERDVKQRFQARALDMFGNSAWTECVFTVGDPPSMNGGGAGGSGGTGGGSGGGGAMTKGGCHCGAGEGLFGVLALALLTRRGRRASRAQRL